MSEISEERVEALASNILECHDVKPSEIKALAGLALLALRERAEPVVVPDLHKVVYHFRDLNEGFPVERFKADYVIAWMLANYPPAPPAPVVPVETFEEWSRRCEIQLTLCRPEFREVAEITWNACRAAMLAAPGKEG
ncbi:hypothetical protein ACVR3A_003827 [Cronobacter sakazakii]|nr:hypothetical protein [Cronobacter sakazakii]